MGVGGGVFWEESPTTSKPLSPTHLKIKGKFLQKTHTVLVSYYLSQIQYRRRGVFYAHALIAKTARNYALKS